MPLLTPQDQLASMVLPFTPPEQPKLDTFVSTVSPLGQTVTPYSGKTVRYYNPISHPPSPPESPESIPADGKGSLQSAVPVLQDPELFSTFDIASTPSVGPLFSPSIDAVSTTEDVPSATSDRLDQLHATSFVQKIVDAYNADRRGYMRRELDMLSAYPSLCGRSRSTAGTKRASSYDPPMPKRQKVARSVAEKVPRSQRAPRQYAVDNEDFDGAAPVIRHRKPSAAPPHRDDTDYAALPDYTPSSATLPGSGKGLKADWRGHPLDLSRDSDRHVLHDAEVALASTLRLSCAQYICSKRRIFMSRLECLRNGKEFRKTTAQQACKIDVNKASKLWTAFDKVGWFEPRHMKEFV